MNGTLTRSRRLHSKSISVRFMPMPNFKLFRPLVPALRDTLRRFIALSLVFVSVFAVGPTAPLFAQVAAAPMMLHITILDGEDSLNNIRERTAREPVVQVEDENHKPVAGALILFSMQNGGTGAGGTFNGLSTLSVTTDSEGKAVAHGLKPNGSEGTYTIAVTATLGALVATAVIHQTNAIGAGGGGAAVPPAVPPPPPTTPPTTVAENPTPAPGGGSTTPTKVRKSFHHIPKKVWITGATIITVGVVVGVVVATHGNNPTTITAGNGSVGP